MEQNSGFPEVLDISCCESELVTTRGCGDQTVNHGKPVPFSFSIGLKGSPLIHLRFPKQNHPVGECRQKIGFQPIGQPFPLSPLGKQQDAFSNFSDGNNTDKQGKGRAFTQP